MRFIVGCEYSGKVRDALIKMGHEAISCDLLPTDSAGPHHQGDLFQFLKGKKFDAGIFHPPCTYLSNSGVCHLYTEDQRWKLMIEAAVFFRKILELDIPKIAIENPIMHGYAKSIIGQTQTQVIQPWMFGHTEKKATCLWLKGLPKLTETNNVKAEMEQLPVNEQQRLHYLPPSPDRWKLRSTTYQGIADAMAEQWS